MTSRSIIALLALALLLINTLPSFGQSQSTDIQFDTSKTTVIPFNQIGYPFNNLYKPATLTQEDIITIDSFLVVCVTDYNNSLGKDHKQWSIDLKKYNYRKQLIVATNKKGEKEVWVNCFCQTFDNERWKTEIILVTDGGNCFFNFKISLTTKKYYEFSVNSLG